MAETVQMKHNTTGVVKNGYYGFSWTSFFFGGIPALIRGDIIYGMAITVFSVLLFWFASDLFEIILLFTFWGIWGAVYNKNYTHRLLHAGYEFNDTKVLVAEAKRVLGVATSSERICSKCHNPLTGNAKHCSQCGTEFTLQGKESQSSRTCEYCVALVKDNDRYCAHCGKDISSTIVGHDISSETTIDNNEINVPIKPPTCAKCGSSDFSYDGFEYACNKCAWKTV